ncbi:MAG: redoxin domain-containing protein [Thermoanaerobaculia bacterium]
MKHWKLAAVLFALFVAQPPLDAAQPVRDFTLPSATDGSLIRLSDYAGKVVLINWWRTDCGWSQKESPRLVGLYQQYRAKGLVILGISDDHGSTVSDIPGYLKRYGINWPVGLNDQAEFMREMVIRPEERGETPGNFLVTRSGDVTYLGLDRRPEDWQKVEKAVAAAVAEPPGKSSPIQPRELVPAPPFNLPDPQGKAVRLSDFKGKPLVVNFFSAGNCDWTGSLLAKLNADYAARGLQVVGIDLFDDNSAIQNCISKHGTKYPVLRGDQATQTAWIGKPLGWATFFVTADGKVFKAIEDSVENGMETAVFAKYADQLVARH